MVKWNLEVSLKDIYAGLALVVAIALSFIGTYLPPLGQIHDSMLYLIAQFLLLVATLMGVGYFYNKWSKKTDMMNIGKKVGERIIEREERSDDRKEDDADD